MTVRGVAVLATLATMWLGGCQPCLERCLGLWSVSFESEGMLADGEYELTATPDGRAPLQGRCTVTDGGSQAVCEGDLRAVAIDDPSVYRQLSLDSADTETVEVEVRLTLDGALLIDEALELDYQGGDSCNPHCASAFHTLSI